MRRYTIYCLLLLLLFGLLTGCGGSDGGGIETETEVAAGEEIAGAAATATTGGATATVTTPAPTITPTGTATATPVGPPTATATVPPAIIEVDGAVLPPGFSIVKFADIVQPTSLTFDAAGTLLATATNGTVTAFRDLDGDGRADSQIEVSFGFVVPLGITVQPGTGDIYLSQQGKITILRDTDGDYVADEVVSFARDLPFGRHQNDNLKFGPDGWLYIGIGSTCDACVETDPRSASIMRFDPVSGAGEVYATGMRNPYDLAFHPITGALFATDNGRDDLGLDAPPEELNHVVAGADYGFPNCWGAAEGTGCAGTTTAVGFFEPHGSANSLDFYRGGPFPDDYDNDLFVGVFGSYLTEVQTGIQRVRLSPAGDTYQAESALFATWPGARPLGLIVGPDGALYVGDYQNGAIFRISYGS